MSIRTGARVNVDAAAWGKDYARKNGGQQFSGTVVTRKSNGDFLVEFDDGRFSCAEEYVHAVCEDDVMAEDVDEDEDEDVVMREDDDGDDEDVAAMEGLDMYDEDPGDGDEEVVEEDAEPATRKRDSTGARKGEDRKARSARESRERAALEKQKDDFVAKHVAARTNKGAGARYEKELKKLEDAIDEHYAGTIAGKAAAGRQQKKKDAAAESVKLQTQIQELRKAPGRLSREERRKLEGLEEELEKERKKARGVKKRDEASAAKKRSDATKAVAKLRREVRKAVREGRAEDVAELEKELTKAERKVAKLEANDRRKEELDSLDSRLLAVVARTTPGTALARDVETCCEALAAGRRLTRLDTSTEDEALGAAVVAVEEAQRGGGKVRADVERALEAMKPSKEVSFGKKRSRREEADQGVEDAKAALDAVKQRRRADDDDVKEAEKALKKAERRQSRVEAVDERAALRKECNERLKAIRETKGGGSHLANAIQDATEALKVFGRQRRPVSAEETDALNNMMDVLANDKGAGIVKRRAEAIAALVEASGLPYWKAEIREAAARELADVKAQLDKLPPVGDVDDDQEDRAKLEGELARVKERVAQLERNDELKKAADEWDQELEALEASGTGDAAYKKSIGEAKTVLTKFRDRTRRNLFDMSEAKAKLRDMLKALRDSPGRSLADRTARDTAVTKAQEALMSHDEIATTCLQAVMPAQASLDTTTAVDAYFQVKDGLTETPLDVSRRLAYALSRAAITRASGHVDALEPLLDAFDRLPRRDERLLRAFVNDATEILGSLENRRQFLCRLEETEEALSRLDESFDALRELRNDTAALDRVKTAATAAGAALAIATALRYYAATKSREEYDSTNEEVARLFAEYEGLKATDGSGSAYDEELERLRDLFEEAFKKTNAGRAAAKWEARVLAAAGTLQLLTQDIISDARVFSDKGHVVCAKIKKDRKVSYVGVTRAGNAVAEAKAVIKRPNFPIKNRRGGPISFKQCEVVIIGEVDSKVKALLIERTLQTEIAGSGEYAPTDYAHSGRGCGTLTHAEGGSEVFAIAIKLAPGDQQRPSPCPRDGVVEFTAEFEAQIAAAIAPPDSMPDERVDGDLDERMIKNTKQRAVYHAYTRGPWSVHWWKRSPRSPFENEQRWLWPSADAARAWTQDKIDQKTTERGGYAIEADDE